MCVCARVCACNYGWFPLSHFHHFKWKYCVWLSSLYPRWWFHGLAQRPRDPGSIARVRPTWVPAPRPPIPGACACGGCFPSVKLYRLCCIFLLFLVQLKFPEGRAKNEATGQRIPWLFTPERSVLYFWKFETQLGTKAMREEGELGAGGRGRGRDLSLPTPDAVLLTGHPPLPWGRLLCSGSRAERAAPCPMRSSLYDTV